MSELADKGDGSYLLNGSPLIIQRSVTLLEKVEKMLPHHRSTSRHIPRTVTTTATETERASKQKREGKRIGSGGTHGRSFHSIVVRDGWILSETQSGTFHNSQSTTLPIHLFRPQIFVIICKYICEEALAKEISHYLNYMPYLLPSKLTSPCTADVPKWIVPNLISLNLATFLLPHSVWGTVNANHARRNTML